MSDLWLKDYSNTYQSDECDFLSSQNELEAFNNLTVAQGLSQVWYEHWCLPLMFSLWWFLWEGRKAVLFCVSLFDFFLRLQTQIEINFPPMLSNIGCSSLKSLQLVHFRCLHWNTLSLPLVFVQCLCHYTQEAISDVGLAL